MNKSKANVIVSAIIEDILDRKGIGNAWEEIDEETKREIEETWRKIVVKESK